VVTVATPAARSAVPRTDVSARNVTVPVGAPENPEAGDTVAVKVMGWPFLAAVVDEVS